MARYNFGGDLASFTILAPSGQSNVVKAQPNATGSVYAARTGGSALTDLLDANGAATSTVTSDTNGFINRFQGPNGYTDLWVDFGGGSRFHLTTVEAKVPTPDAADLVLYVSARGNDNHDGLTWRNAKATVKAALTSVGASTGARIEIGQGSITETTAWGTIPSNTVIRGQGKYATTLVKGFNGDWFTPGQGVTLSDFTMDGAGATRTGKIANITGTLGGQTFDRLKLYNSDGECIWFGYQAGSGFVSNNCDIWRYNAASGSGRYAIVVENVTQLSAVPRTFHGLASGGQATFDFGGCNDFFVTSSFLNDLNFVADSRGVLIMGSRLASPMATTSIRGSNNTIVGCDVYSSLQIESGVGGICIGPNAYQNAPVDLSGLSSNKITHESYAYTPTVTTSGTATTLGNGTITGYYSRSGAQITVDVDFTVGSTTSFGTGEIRFSLPYTRSHGSTVVNGVAVIFPAGGSAQYVAAVQIVGAVGYVRMIRDTVGLVAAASSPWGSLASGSNIRVGITYRQ